MRSHAFLNQRPHRTLTTNLPQQPRCRPLKSSGSGREQIDPSSTSTVAQRRHAWHTPCEGASALHGTVVHGQEHEQQERPLLASDPAAGITAEVCAPSPTPPSWCRATVAGERLEVQRTMRDGGREEGCGTSAGRRKVGGEHIVTWWPLESKSGTTRMLFVRLGITVLQGELSSPAKLGTTTGPA